MSSRRMSSSASRIGVITSRYTLRYDSKADTERSTADHW